MTQEKLQEAKRLYKTANANQRYVLESLFPELAESEDEKKTQESLMQYIWDIYHTDFYPPKPSIECFDKWLAWLEKQGEKPVEEYNITGITSGYAKGKLGEIIKDIEAEPFDKYEGFTDFERTLADICIGWIGEELGWKQYIKDNADVLLKIAIEKFNSVQDVSFKQKPTDEEMKEALRTEYGKGRADAIAEMQVAWSKKDEKMLNILISSLARIGASTRTDSTSINYTFSKEIDWLKSLKQRIGG